MSVSSSEREKLPEFQVLFESDDPDDPQNWPAWYKAWTIGTVSFCSLVVVLYSTSYIGSVSGLQEEFHVSRLVTTMGMTTYLVGLAFGSLVMAPMSELYGRRIIYISCLCVWAVCIFPCGAAQSVVGVLVPRLFSGFFGAALVSNGPGTVVDVCKPKHLAMGMSVYSLGPFNGPVLGPLVGGFVFQYLGWRWTNWVILILGGFSIAIMLTVKETYAPEILKRRVARMQYQSGNKQWWCQYDQECSSMELIWKNLSRPLVLFFTEPIVWFINVWNALIYGMLYLCFIAYPIVFSEHRGWGPAKSGLSYLGIGVGIVLAVLSEPIIRRLINAQPRNPTTGKPYPEAAALVMAIGAVLTPIGQFGFSWTGLPQSIHWAIPICFGIPFGAGNTLSFVYSSNYLAGSYGIFAASALASNAIIRSFFGAFLPLAGTKMYAALTPQIAGTLCGALQIVMIPIPLVFWRWGHKIRERSKLIQ
ncbi:hypothetical protein QQS21_000632 [Conoideocrella luteorostrata]|uniref:Major facilitator superfamily (MFS) profile domain-containing protein n=1 Tax=Conoideocrella luteorostrata TaxID=1105319 RepID=A0AAJ0D0Q2_9HYPO|nr:hypothetical protein QQS21_000632 [Conoideocrella luteorostrata]